MQATKKKAPALQEAMVETQSPILQFLVGGVTLVVINAVANAKGAHWVKIAGIVSTIPLMDMLPVLYAQNVATSTRLALSNAISNIGVVASMFVLSTMLRTRSRPLSVAVAMASWLFLSVLCTFFLVD